MALIAFTSASGSPGVSTTVMALAYNWGAPALVVEADPTGGSGMLVGPLRAQRPGAGCIVDLLAAQESGQIGSKLDSVLMPLSEQLSLLPGPRSHEQASGLARLWPSLAGVLRERSEDVLVDCGRLGMGSWPRAIVESADLVVLALRSSLRQAAAASSWARELAAGEVPQEHECGLLLIGKPRPYPLAELAKHLGIKALAEIAWDSSAAHVYSDGGAAPRSFAVSAYLRSITALAAKLRSPHDSQ